MSLKQHIIISTAGHIDHGKTALIKALTGVDADTLPEEKRRGMTIDLGFVFMEDSAAVRQIVFIDVPGHEKFIKTMAAGAANVDAALLVVAADEGISVQTREHFDILRLLRIPAGLVALSKCDLVSDELREQRREEIKKFVRGSFLENAAIIPVSAVSGEGLDSLRFALRNLASTVKPRIDTGVFRLPIDRVFSLPGFGTIVAGTLLSGEVKVGDRVKIYPKELETRVRNIHVHQSQQPKSQVGLRTALNVPELKKEDLRRGQVVAHPGTLSPTLCLDVFLELLLSAKELRNRERIRIHLGTDEFIGRVSLLDRGILKPGESGPAQLYLEAPAAALPQDRFVIRTFSPCLTIGGGQVLDAMPAKHKRFDQLVLAGFQRLTAGETEMLAEMIRRGGSQPMTVAKLGQQLGWREEKVQALLPSLRQKGIIVSIPGGKEELFLHQENLDSLAVKLRQLVEEFFAKQAHLSHMPLVELRSRFLALSSFETFSFLLEKLAQEKSLIVEEGQVSFPGRTGQLTRREAEVCSQIEMIYLRAGLTPPLEEEVKRELKAEPAIFKKAFHRLYQEKKLVRLSEKVTMHSSVWKKVENFVREYLKLRGKITIAELRDHMKITRKYACAILEFLDRRGITKRLGDEHVLK